MKELPYLAIFLITIFLLSTNAHAQTTISTDLTSPLTLDRVMERFLQRNLSLEAARYRVEAARAEQIAARLRPNPSLTVSVENVKVSGDTPFNRLYEVSATYSQTIELGGKRRLRREVADLGVSVAEAQLADVLRQRMFEVKRAYYEALLARETLADAIENRDNFNELAKFNQIRFEEGAIAEGELLKVRLERIKFDTAVSQAQLAVRQAGIKLLELLGETDFTSAEMVAGDLSFTQFNIDLVTLKETALRNRPDLLTAEQNTKLSERRIALERARNAMDITPFGGYKRVGLDNTVLFGITIPLRINNQNQAAIARAMADEKIAETELAIVHNRVLAEVESAYRAYETARTQVITFQRELLPQADESRSIALAAYREGATDLLPLLEAQRTNADIRYQHLRSLADYQISLLRLEAAIGEDVKP
ncbi:MAG: TolC family protein [Acidobacteriota bacterium]